MFTCFWSHRYHRLKGIMAREKAAGHCTEAVTRYFDNEPRTCFTGSLLPGPMGKQSGNVDRRSSNALYQTVDGESHR